MLFNSFFLDLFIKVITKIFLYFIDCNKHKNKTNQYFLINNNNNNK